MYKKTFKLIQHTPIIHFQPDQIGAVLRASDIKPRLDRFMIEKMGGEKEVRKQHPDWFISNDSIALNYKMRIEDNLKIPLKDRSINKIKLMSKGIEDMKAIVKSDVSATVFSFYDDLIKIILDHVPLFFLANNFGTRQTKAWGCYYHESHDKWEKVIKDLKKLNVPVYLSTDTISTNDKKTQRFYDTITKKWRGLKSGQGGSDYKKAFLFKYLCSNNIRWDKRWIKLRLNKLITDNVLPQKLKATHEPNECISDSKPCDNTTLNSWVDDPNKEYKYRFGRAMLGLAEHYEFEAEEGYKYQVEVKSKDNVQRFKSPVIFKIYDNNLFAIATDVSCMNNKHFYFEIKVKRTNGRQYNQVGNAIAMLDDHGNHDILFTPLNKEEFDMVSFLDTYFKCINFTRISNH